jgi:hypothetical protein
MSGRFLLLAQSPSAEETAPSLLESIREPDCDAVRTSVLLNNNAQLLLRGSPCRRLGQSRQKRIQDAALSTIAQIVPVLTC